VFAVVGWESIIVLGNTTSVMVFGSFAGSHASVVKKHVKKTPLLQNGSRGIHWLVTV